MPSAITIIHAPNEMTLLRRYFSPVVDVAPTTFNVSYLLLVVQISCKAPTEPRLAVSMVSKCLAGSAARMDVFHFHWPRLEETAYMRLTRENVVKTDTIAFSVTKYHRNAGFPLKMARKSRVAREQRELKMIANISGHQLSDNRRIRQEPAISRMIKREEKIRKDRGSKYFKSPGTVDGVRHWRCGCTFVADDTAQC